MVTRTFLAILVGISAFLFDSFALAQPDRFFAAYEDNLWSKFLEGPCTLIEGVPIVGRSRYREALASDAILSSVIGYYEREFPILGPPVPRRVDRLVFAMTSASKVTDLSQQDELRKALSTIEAESFAKFEDISLKYPAESDGVLRVHFSSSLGRKALEEKLKSIAKERHQTVTIQPIREVSYSAIRNTMLAKKPAILNVDNSKFMYLVVGFFQAEALPMVIDPDSAKPVAVPAEEVFLTEQDRKSEGRFATRAREILKGQEVLVDEVTSCKGKRPAGLRFISLKNLLDHRPSLQVIQGWELDKDWLQLFSRGR